MDAKTKKILIYGAVALGAYLLYKKYSKKDETVVVVTDEEVMSEAAGRRRMSKRRVPTTQKANGGWIKCKCGTVSHIIRAENCDAYHKRNKCDKAQGYNPYEN